MCSNIIYVFKNERVLYVQNTSQNEFMHMEQNSHPGWLEFDRVLHLLFLIFTKDLA